MLILTRFYIVFDFHGNIPFLYVAPPKHFTHVRYYGNRLGAYVKKLNTSPEIFILE